MCSRGLLVMLTLAVIRALADSSATSGQTAGGGGEVAIIAGGHFDPLPQVITYTSSVPINFEVPWPSKIDMTESSVNSVSSCTQGISSDWCIMFKELKQYISYSEILLSHLVESAGEDVTEPEINLREKRGLTFVGEFLAWCCDVAVTNQVENLFGNEKNLNYHLNLLENQILHTHEGLANLSNAVHVMNEGMSTVLSKVQSKFNNFKSVLQKFRSSVSDRFSGLAKEMSQTHQMLLYLATHLTKISHAIVRIEVLDSCRNQLLPAVLISPGALITKLKSLDAVLVQDGYRAAISITRVHKYYSLKISRCKVFKNKLFIQLKVPLVRLNSNWMLMNFVPIPFRWKNSTCHLDSEPTYLAVDNTRIVPIRGRYLQDCRALSEGLCFVPRFSGDAMNGALCPKAVYQGETAEELSERCIFSCFPGSQLLITQAGPERYFLTNAYGVLNVTCILSQNHSLQLGEGKPGAIDVAVPCDCKLILNDDLIVDEMFPCDRKADRHFKFLYVIPASWGTIKKIKISAHPTSSHTVFPSFEECIAENWTESIPHINFSIGKALPKVDAVSLQTPTEVTNLVLRNWSSFILGGFIILVTYIVVRNPFLIGLGSFPRVVAVHKDELVAVELGSIAVLIFVSFVVCVVLSWLWWKGNRKMRATLNVCPKDVINASTQCEQNVPNVTTEVAAVSLQNLLMTEQPLRAKLKNVDGEEVDVLVSLYEETIE